MCQNLSDKPGMLNTLEQVYGDTLERKTNFTFFVIVR